MPAFSGFMRRLCKRKQSYHPVSRGHHPSHFQPGWRPTVLVWTGVTSAVLAANLSILIWAQTRGVIASQDIPGSSADQIAANDKGKLLFQGDCQHVYTIKSWVHLAINVVSTILLLASANCMQCLSSPTREEIDLAHADGIHLDVGILSTRNLRRISKTRAIAWITLALTSIPLHLFYNSIIFSTLAERQVFVAVGSEQFANDSSIKANTIEALLGSKSLVDGKYGPGFYDERVSIISSVMTNLMPKSGSHTVTKLSIEECMSAFSTRINSRYRSVVFVTDIDNSTQILDFKAVAGVAFRQPFSCYNPGNASQYHNTNELLNNCRYGDNKDYGCHPSKTFNQCDPGGSQQNNRLPSSPWKVDYCLVEEVPEYCIIELSNTLMIIVVVSNAFKVLAMLHTTRFLKFKPMITIGDVIQTFMKHPDQRTFGAGPISAGELGRIRKQYKRSEDHEKACHDNGYSPWRPCARRFFFATSGMRWIYGLGLVVLTEAAAGAVLAIVTGSSGLLNSAYGSALAAIKDSAVSGLGDLNGNFFFSIGGDTGIAVLSIVSNLPQLVISLVYVVYYALVASLVLVDEACAFAKKRKTLRVSPPRVGQQRSTYWLTAPLRYNLPLMLAIALVHFFVSQSIYIIRVGAVTVEGMYFYGVVNGIGYSPVAIIASMATLSALILFLVFYGLRRLPPGIPLLGHNSLVIAAACHPDPSEPSNATELPIMYGVLPTLGGTGKRRVGFSSRPVESLRAGEIYEATICKACIVRPDAMGPCQMHEHTGPELGVTPLAYAPAMSPKEKKENLRDGRFGAFPMDELDGWGRRRW